MNGETLLARVAELKWPVDEYCVFGSGPIAVFGFREANEIDILATPEFFESLKSVGWKEELIEAGNPPKPTPVLRHPAHPKIDIFKTWEYVGFAVASAQIIEDAWAARPDDEADSPIVPMAQLDYVIEWKRAFGRPKDLEDLALIERVSLEGAQS